MVGRPIIRAVNKIGDIEVKVNIIYVTISLFFIHTGIGIPTPGLKTLNNFTQTTMPEIIVWLIISSGRTPR